MIEKVMSLVWQASPFVPKGSLSGHIPETLCTQRRNMNKRIYEIKVRLAADEMAYLNQIAMNAHVLNAIDAKHYDEGVRLFQDAVQNILSAVLDPIPIDKLTQGRAEVPVPNDERNDVYRKEVM